VERAEAEAILDGDRETAVALLMQVGELIEANRRLEARVAELESLPGWTWDPFTDDWNVNLAALRTFVAREPAGRVPPRRDQKHRSAACAVQLGVVE